MSLQITTPPAAEPILLADVKARLRLTSTTDDATITQMLTVAREFAEKVTRRSLAFKTYTLFLDRFPWHSEPIRLPAPPLVQVNSVQFLDDTLTLQTWDPSEYYVVPMQSPGLIVEAPGYIYPPTARVPGAVQISFNSGYNVSGTSSQSPLPPSIPQHLAEGIRQLVIHCYEHPNAVSNEGLKEIPKAMMDFFRANRFYEF